MYLLGNRIFCIILPHVRHPLQSRSDNGSGSTDPLSACGIWIFLLDEQRPVNLDDPFRSCAVESALLHLGGGDGGDGDDGAAVCVVTYADADGVRLTDRYEELKVSYPSIHQEVS